jgi:hypothetical protein
MQKPKGIYTPVNMKKIHSSTITVIEFTGLFDSKAKSYDVLTEASFS